ncbi:Hypothetical protein FKW44_020992, partial [Caligus rogercresseyi]
NCYLTSDFFSSSQVYKYSGAIFHSRDLCGTGIDKKVHSLRRSLPCFCQWRAHNIP